jgi:sRNA-binding carbon storage regulator CsrA
MMLVLERRINEDVVLTIPGWKRPIIVRVCKLGNGWAKIGFDGPSSVRIARREIIKEEGTESQGKKRRSQ